MLKSKQISYGIAAFVIAVALVLFAVWWPSSFYRVTCMGYLNIKPLHINGKAVDSGGHPLPGVAIQISWSTAKFLIGLPYDHNQTSWVTSDKKGEWTFKLEKPDQMSIRTAQKEGYAFDPLHSTRSDMVGQAAQRKLQEFPATVVMRKKKEESLLIGYRGQYDRGDLYLETVQGKSKQVVVDILAGYENRKKPEYTDLQVSANFDPTNACWTLIVRAPDGHGGLVNRNELLFEAPEAGYAPEVVFKTAIKDNSPEDKNYIYLKSRKQGLYTRVLYHYDSWDDPQYGLVFRVYLGMSTNPYGERSFEDAQELRKYTFARDELIQEAKKAIQSGTLPKKPENLAKHMEERDKILEEAWRNPRR
jgi:hypothetical protein